MITYRCCLKLMLSVAVLALAAGCFRLKPSVTVSCPNVFGEDTVFKVFAERRKAIRELAKGIQAGAINEAYDIAEARSFKLSAALSPAALGPLKQPDPVNATKPVPPNQMTQPVGRTYSELLRDLIQNDQDVAGYELLYLGDSHIMDKTKSVYLLQFQICLNNRRLQRRGEPQFVPVYFRIKSKDGGDIKDAHVYALAPEYSAVLAEESLSDQSMVDLAAQAGATLEGVNVAVAGNMQKLIEERFKRLVSYPIQFAIYCGGSAGRTDNANEMNENGEPDFGFALGPRRTIIPTTWYYKVLTVGLGRKMKIGYEYEPGPRDCYALVTVPKEIRTVTLDAFIGKEAYSRRVFSPERTTGKEEWRRLRSPAGGGEEDENWTRQRRSVSLPKRDSTPDTISTGIERTIAGGKTAGGRPFPIVDTVPSSFIISTKDPVCGNSEVLIGGRALPQKDIEVIGRRRLRVTVVPDKGLVSLLERMGALCVEVVTPGKKAEEVGKAVLYSLKGEPDKPKEKEAYAIEPIPCVAGQVFTIKSLGKTSVLSDVVAVRIGEKVVPRDLFYFQDAEKITLVMPEMGKSCGLRPFSVAMQHPEKDGKLAWKEVDQKVQYAK